MKRIFEVCVDFARTPVMGLCINISEQIINDVLYNLEKDDAFLMHNPLCPANKKFDLFESLFKPDDILSIHLKNLSRYINEEERTINISDSEFYYGIANKLLFSQNMVRREISGIKLQRYEVKKELYKRLLMAKEIMDDQGENLKISGIAEMVSLSQFHFYSTFKQAFGITPHQYQIKNKLQKAASLLEAGNTTIEDVAYDCGFTDIFSFSKTFRKHFNTTPSSYKKLYTVPQ